MPIADFIVKRDKFQPIESGWLAFPCCDCAHQSNDDNEEPCNTCDHNMNCEPEK